ncbi:hypothetical protein [Dokdonella fugitiva]|uniref:Uncharacterized protein n=1 Tax=Dokdonella fugitiva TaxID=328517 RepID=A0A4R2IJ87_9GAMM|nr:hypothetical protein [Dokdonella fugitiva]TCO42775.1 hypothetical protein EV148_101181 [Dokdonella fugitiva]
MNRHILSTLLVLALAPATSFASCEIDCTAGSACAPVNDSNPVIVNLAVSEAQSCGATVNQSIAVIYENPNSHLCLYKFAEFVVTSTPVTSGSNLSYEATYCIN